MTTPTKLLFGIRTSEPLSLSITTDGPLPQQPPDLRIKTSEQEIAIPCSNNAWVTTLGVGDHIAYMPDPGDSRFEAPLTCKLSAPATIVSWTVPAKELQTWIATTASISPKDSKNPWPPPLDSSTPLPDQEWLGSTLTTMRSQLPNDRSSPPLTPPAGTPGPSRPR